jgi:pyruvate,water dikinase
MDEKENRTDDIMRFLQEREKELNCLYKIEGLLNQPDVELRDVCKDVIAAIPPGWQYPDICQATITVGDFTCQPDGFKETPWVQSADIIVQDRKVGEIKVYYTEEMPAEDDGPFPIEEVKLLNTIADRLGHFLTYRKLTRVFQEYRNAKHAISEDKKGEWRIALKLLRQTDKNLYYDISQRMLNHLSWSGFEDAEKLIGRLCGPVGISEDGRLDDENRPLRMTPVTYTDELSNEIFEIVDKHFSDDQILSLINKWILEDKFSFLTKLSRQILPLSEVADTMRRFYHMASDDVKLPPSAERGIQVSLIRRLLSDETQFINIAKKYIHIDDFHDLLDHIVFPSESYGKLGGKSAGLLLAKQVIEREWDSLGNVFDVKVPKTWYVPSDAFSEFLSFNNLDEVVEQKYKEIDQVRLEYPHIVRTFKSCGFPPDITQGLSLVLDDLSDKPLVIRSSSLLEDRVGAAFSGKYRSLFIANQGTKQERLESLMDAIAQVYASIFAPDPIEYRAERGFLDFAEEMGIMVQEVVGTEIGDYYFPSFAGVAFSKNEFRWSPRIKREDGLIRLVPGLGTRAVDRLADDYPILIAPGQRGLRVNVTVDEVLRYSPKMIDVINLKTNTFETVEIRKLFKEVGENIPSISKIVSVFDGQHISKPSGKMIGFDEGQIVPTFEGLIADTDFGSDVKLIMDLLEDKLGTPVDIEFASDGKDFYLLQCRAQSYSEGATPAPIPRDIPKDRIIFSANRYISNGRVPDITHIVYVDPQKYDEMTDKEDLVAVGRAVGKLNKLLPKRKFILMGPGRWGSIGDIKLGVRVTYSDINNTSALIEIARKKGDFVPDLSFGTHFFQDLVEAGIRYLPLYPDDDNTAFNERFLKGSENILPQVAPEYKNLSSTVRLIDVPKSTDGQFLRILMNADLNEAVGFLEDQSEFTETPGAARYRDKVRQREDYWSWRMRMAESIASELDAERFGVEGFYVFGSTKNATAGPASDIDVLIHFRGTQKQREELMVWLEGWSLCLAELNYSRTGYRSDGLLDVHIVTDEDIAKKTSYAAKIDATTDPAKPLPMAGGK